ncbi:uncharacterized protein LOC134253346 [Saccostrea cucullata]|uniref:uncharacterized protein LOC134253346 n=1 Tax=Saccostrea cuccullata TaxID=36930 RepID=UPI002ED1B3DB
MGCCFSSENEETNPKTPLIKDNKGGGSPYTSPSTQTAPSARKYKAQDPPPEKDFLTSIDLLATADMKNITIPSLNKTFQDQGKVFDEIFQQFQNMRESLNNFKSHFTVETDGIPVLSRCMQILTQRCGNCKLTVERRKYSVVIVYENQDVMRNSTTNPQQVLDCLQLFNSFNKNIQKILERAPEVENSAKILLDDEDNMRKEVTKADLAGTEGPEAMKRCNENIHKLRKMNSHLKTIKSHTERTMKEVIEASKALFNETNP